MCIIMQYYWNYIICNFVLFILIELEASKKQTEADKKVIDDLVRERDILNKVNENSNYNLILSYQAFSCTKSGG